MSKPLLVIGNKNLSSWSLRPWLALKVAGVDFDERVLMLDTPELKSELSKIAPASPRRVPVFVHDDVTLWESLAICEYAAETWAPSLWPADKRARAYARTIANEMHAGFLALRRACSMNLKADLKGTTLTPEAHSDVQRVLQIWRECRARFAAGGPFLFGAFTIADAMYAPVATRLTTYGIAADDAQDYVDALQTLPAFVEWKSAALNEHR